MEDKIVIYKTGEDGSFGILWPTGLLPIEEVAKKDVPPGVPYMIIDRSDLPKDGAYRGAWTTSFDDPHGNGIGHHKWYEENKDILIDISQTKIGMIYILRAFMRGGYWGKNPQ